MADDIFNMRLSKDYRVRLRAIATHKGLGTEAACVRWLIAEKWEKLKGDIALPAEKPAPPPDPAATGGDYDFGPG